MGFEDLLFIGDGVHGIASNGIDRGCEMKVALGAFACEEIAAQTGPDIAAGISAALRHYQHRLSTDREMVGIPGFANRLRTQPVFEGELQLDPDIKLTLEREMHKQGASAEQLTTHAVLVYLAELDEPRTDVDDLVLTSAP